MPSILPFATMYNLEDMTRFADDAQLVIWSKHLVSLIGEKEISLEVLSDWLRQSGMKVRDYKPRCGSSTERPPQTF